MTTDTANPVLVALANRRPEFDGIRWRVSVNPGTIPSREYIRGDKIDTGDSRVLAFRLDDGTEKRYGPGEWVSAVGMPAKCDGTDLAAIVHREYMFGEADMLDIVQAGAWLQRQPEWIEFDAAQRTQQV